MNKSQRIKVNLNEQNQDKHLQLKLEQDIDTLEIMSLKIDTKEAYQNFNADYGVLVGRVIANNAIGIPNVRVSIFIPLDEDDENNGEIVSIYPYKRPSDKNNDGKRYNLLPRVSSINPDTGKIRPQQPFGSFPTREEFITNPTYLEVYKKYYKYSTITNSSGDYMIFGIPTGTQTVHMSADITDIGELSMTPASMITNLGYSPNFFTSDGTRIKESNDLEDLPHIETQEISVDVIPFWGDNENFEIGITRQDFRIRAQLNYNVVLFGSSFTDGDGAMWGDNFAPQSGARAGELYRARNMVYDMSSKRIGRITENIYYYPPDVTEEEIASDNFDFVSRTMKLDPSDYSSYKRDGDFVFIINCNRGKVITSETGEEIPVNDDYNGGIYKEFWGFITLEYTPDDIPMNFQQNIGDDVVIKPLRYKFKFPQNAIYGETFGVDADEDNEKWKKQYYKFTGGKYYSVARFHGQTELANGSNNTATSNFDNINTLYYVYSVDTVNKNVSDPNWIVGVIRTSEGSNPTFGLEKNWTNQNGVDFFGGNWLNFTIYFPQVGYAAIRAAQIGGLRISSNMTRSSKLTHYVIDNNEVFVAGDSNTKWFARSDIHPTSFIETTQDEIRFLLNQNLPKGFTDSNIDNFENREGKYWNAQEQVPRGNKKYVFDQNLNPPQFVPKTVPSFIVGNSGKENLQDGAIDKRYYFYKGYDTADCIQFLNEIGLL